MARWFGRVKCSDQKLFPCAFAVGCGDDRCMDVEKIALLEKQMGSKGKSIANAGDCALGVSAWTQVGDRS